MALLNTLTKNGNKSSMSDGVQREDLKVLIKVLSGVTAGDISVAAITATGAVDIDGAVDMSSTVLMSNASIKMTALPTSASGLVVGALWNNSGVVNIKSS
tara:strand:+ start:7051 stop:7350 length:300 start_codon:yes stop_codon:yes gene_type:complete